MTLQEVTDAIETFGNNNVRLALTENRVIIGVLQNAYSGDPSDPKGSALDYFYVRRIDVPNNPTEKYDCQDVISIDEQ